MRIFLQKIPSSITLADVVKTEHYIGNIVTFDKKKVSSIDGCYELISIYGNVLAEDLSNLLSGFRLSPYTVQKISYINDLVGHGHMDLYLMHGRKNFLTRNFGSYFLHSAMQFEKGIMSCNFIDFSTMELVDMNTALHSTVKRVSDAFAEKTGLKYRLSTEHCDSIRLTYMSKKSK